MEIPYQIQPLRILGGWTIKFNNFFECEPDSCNDFGSYFTEDLLQLKNSRYNLLIDLGWYSDENGQYILYLIKDFNWECPLEVFKSRDTNAVVEKVELWTNYNFFEKYI